MEGDLGRRVPERGTGDEFGRLAHNTDAMLERIQLLMDGMRRVSSDIAHDLRVPLTQLRQRLEAARGGPRTVEAAIEAASGDVDTILRVSASLLRIAQVEAGARRGGFAEVDLSSVFAATVEAYGPVWAFASRTTTSCGSIRSTVSRRLWRREHRIGYGRCTIWWSEYARRNELEPTISVIVLIFITYFEYAIGSIIGTTLSPHSFERKQSTSYGKTIISYFSVYVASELDRNVNFFLSENTLASISAVYLFWPPSSL